MIPGMTCGSCAEKVHARLLEHPEVEFAAATLQPSQAEVITKHEFEADKLNAWLEPRGRHQVFAGGNNSSCGSANSISARHPSKSVNSGTRRFIATGVERLSSGSYQISLY